MRCLTLVVAIATIALAQPYSCDWSVNGIGGASMASSAYRSEATAGQTAVGFVAAGGLLASIGFWLPDHAAGIREQEIAPVPGRFVTRLEAVAPNPARGRAVIRYSLAADGPVSLTVHDLTGRMVCVLVVSGAKRGAHSVTWNGCDSRGRRLADGVYFVRLVAGELRSTEKVLLTR